MMEALTDGRTDTRNFGRYNIISSPLFVAGHKQTKLKHVLHVYTNDCGAENILSNSKMVVCIT